MGATGPSPSDKQGSAPGLIGRTDQTAPLTGRGGEKPQEAQSSLSGERSSPQAARPVPKPRSSDKEQTRKPAGPSPEATALGPLSVDPERAPSATVPTVTRPNPSKKNSGSASPLPVGVAGALAYGLYLLGKEIFNPAERCTSCTARTRNPSRICNSCQARINAEEERRRQEEQREAQRRAEEARRREAEQRQKREEEERRRGFRTIADLQRLSGDEFERLVASLFEKDGYKVFRHGGSGDEGVDIVLEIGGSKDVVQCKRWKNDMGAAVIREFYGSMMHAGARHGFIVTTASISQGARDFAVGKPITLVDAQYLLAWINGQRSSRSSTGTNIRRGNGFDPYEVLGVPRGATKEEIRSAYLTLVSKYHPDKVTHLGKEFQDIANERTQAIIRAYQMLMSG